MPVGDFLNWDFLLPQYTDKQREEIRQREEMLQEIQKKRQQKERDVHIDEFMELLQETRKREGNLKIGVVLDITDEWNSKDTHSMRRWKHKQSMLYKIQLVTDEVTLQEDGDEGE